MQSSQARTRRQRKDSFGDDDDGASSLAREGYRSSPPRDRVDMREDKYSFRRDDDGYGSGRSRTGYSPSKDHLHRRGRDDFERRDTESWASVGDSHYSRPRKDDTGYSTAGRGDSRAEGLWPSNRSDHRDADNSQWTPDNEHSSYREDRNRRRFNTNDRQKDGWGKSDSKRSSNTRDWRRDNGWEGRRRSTVDEHSGQQAPPSTSDNSRQQGEERTWEPAASWKPNNRPGHNQNQGQGQGQNQKRQNNRNKGKKKKHNQQKKDWRAPDDSHLNNWTKREGPSTNFKNSRNGVKRHQPRSPSRSPSRSPESFYSHRSSPGRSLSSDPPSRHRRADVRYSSRRSRSPIESGSGLRRYSRSPLPSPRSPWRTPSPNFRGRAPRRNFSSPSVSSRSRSRTRSRSLSGSPRERSRTVHRLPRATSYKDVQVSMSKGSQSRVATLPLRANAPQKNGKEKHSKRDRKPQPSKGKERATGPKVSSSAMPPPSLPAFASESRPSTSQPPPEPSPSPETQKVKETTPRSIPIRPGFKPIGQPSSSLKRFFPGEDDDDNEQTPQPLISKPTFVPASSDKSVVPSGQSNTHSRGDWRNPLDTRDDARNRRSPVPSTSPTTVPMAISPPSHRQSTIPNIRTTAPDNTTPPATRPASPVSASDEVYVIVSQVGEGTFGKVYKARNVITGRFVALKRIRMEAERDGFPVTAMREIKLLQSLRHENVVRLHEMMVANGSVYMVFEYMDHDLTGILSQTQFSFDHGHLKSLCRQMFSGLAYLHQKGVIHRDIKGSNILVNNRGELKLGDFGLARFYQKRRRSDYTNRVITLWYRPPELLFGTTVYGPEVDMWSAGCIMLELFTKKPVFQGNDEIHQLDVIYRLLGTPTSDRWPEVTSLPWYELVKPREVIPNHFAELFQKWIPSQLGLALAERLLAYNPARRATAAQAFDDDYFKESPTPSPPTGLSQLEGEWHELETKRERAKKRRKTEGGSSGPH